MNVSKEMAALLRQMCIVAEGGTATQLIGYDELHGLVHELQFLIKSCADHAEVMIEACGFESDD